jgi:aerobic carbon-monoxide dehydrogenase small subunit
MTAIRLTVNGCAIEADVEPRTHLADVLREHLDLTGTHLGCEHGVCGACTLLLDDVPARSCITYAVACDGASVTTIEGLDDDEIAIELRAAFTREHALQCGYCTPGMLISARDLVLRLPDADEQLIRIGLSGNLCRCTGYVGIVRAIKSVIAQRRARGVMPILGAGRTCLGPAGSGHQAKVIGTSAEKAAADEPAAQDQEHVAIPDFIPAQIVTHHFTLPYTPDRVFHAFADIKGIAACLPGVALTRPPRPDRAEGVIKLKLGPIAAQFQGAARIESDAASLSGCIIGIGSDQRSRSRTQGEIRYQLVALENGAATRVDLSIGYSLTGLLAQIARPGLVRDLAARLTLEFARNLERQLAGAATDAPAPPAKSVNGFSLLAVLMRDRTHAIFRRIIGR